MYSHLVYDPSSPTFLRYSVNRGKYRIGDQAGSIKKSRIEIMVNKTSHSANRVVWSICHRSPVPSDMVIIPLDGDPFNLSIENLVAMTWQQFRLYTSLIKGQGFYNIHPNKNGTFRAYFVTRVKGVSEVECLGTYNTEEEAKEVYRRRQVKELLVSKLSEVVEGEPSSPFIGNV